MTAPATPDDARIARLEEAERAATPELWSISLASDGSAAVTVGLPLGDAIMRCLVCEIENRFRDRMTGVSGLACATQDAALIALARNELPWLIERAKRADQAEAELVTEKALTEILRQELVRVGTRATEKENFAEAADMRADQAEAELRRTREERDAAREMSEAYFQQGCAQISGEQHRATTAEATVARLERENAALREEANATIVERRTWLVIRDPGCVPDRKGPFRADMLARTLREAFMARPNSYIEVLTVDQYGSVDIQDGPECLQMIDGRSRNVAACHNQRLRTARAAHLLSADPAPPDASP